MLTKTMILKYLMKSGSAIFPLKMVNSKLIINKEKANFCNFNFEELEFSGLTKTYI